MCLFVAVFLSPFPVVVVCFVFNLGRGGGGGGGEGGWLSIMVPIFY